MIFTYLNDVESKIQSHSFIQKYTSYPLAKFQEVSTKIMTHGAVLWYKILENFDLRKTHLKFSVLNMCFKMHQGHMFPLLLQLEHCFFCSCGIFYCFGFF